MNIFRHLAKNSKNLYHLPQSHFQGMQLIGCIILQKVATYNFYYYICYEQ